MKNIYCITATLIFLLFAIPTVGVSIISIIIGSQNFHTVCDGPFIKLSTWLMINGVFNILSIIMFTILSILFFRSEQFCYVVITTLFYCFVWVFTLLWNILGAVELFKYAEDCRLEAESLWIMVLISLISQWIGMFATCCIKRLASTNPKYKKIPDEERLVFE